MLKKLFNGNNIWGKSKLLLLLGLVGVFLILLGDFAGTLTSTSSSSPSVSQEQKQVKSASAPDKNLEQQLEKILSQIEGVGEVQVKISLASSAQRIYARNTTESRQKTVEEKDSQLVKRRIRHNQESEVVILNKEGQEAAAVRKKIKPKIEGVLVVAEGAYNSQVKANLIWAVEKGLGIPTYKIAVLPKED